MSEAGIAKNGQPTTRENSIYMNCDRRENCRNRRGTGEKSKVRKRTERREHDG